MQEYFWARLCQLADSKSDSKAMTQFKQLLLLSAMAAESNYTTLQNERQQSVNDFQSCVLGN